MKSACFVIIATLISLVSSAGDNLPADFFHISNDSIQVHEDFIIIADTTDQPRIKENKKLIAIVLAITLGPFGGHRIYLGSHYMVPIAYVLTLGGGLGIIPALDIIAMLLTSDMDAYINNNRFFMWTGKLRSLDSN